MYFTVQVEVVSPAKGRKNCVFLIVDEWNDWYKFVTSFTLIYFDDWGAAHVIGSTKIGQFNMGNAKRPDLPREFDALSDKFFSLGQDESFYQALNNFEEEVREKILKGLNDIALNEDLFERAIGEEVTQASLLRDVTEFTVRGQFRRMANGGARLTDYNFSYIFPNFNNTSEQPIEIDFSIHPESFPGTNIHILIGRNGVGKTKLISDMIYSACRIGEKNNPTRGVFKPDVVKLFANVVLVNFSSFDAVAPIVEFEEKIKKLNYIYVGMRRHEDYHLNKGNVITKTPDLLGFDFAQSFTNCKSGIRRKRWERVIKLLESDPIFKDSELLSLLELKEEPNGSLRQYIEPFLKLSSGHKIVLLTITKLVETVEEKTLVLIDEPESHLHPPLLSALIRAISDLLFHRNGVAIIATHSPVVLQEVPRSCVWKLRRSGDVRVCERLEIESFGENVGVLTREVFGLEVTNSGFHKMISDAVNNGDSFDSLMERFGGQIGMEGQAIARALIADRQKKQF